MTKEDYILKRMNNFFNDDRFSFPAISSDDEFDSEYSDKDIWDEIILDKTAVGFTFTLGEEDIHSIVFSKKSKLVVEYFNCC